MTRMVGAAATLWAIVIIGAVPAGGDVPATGAGQVPLMAVLDVDLGNVIRPAPRELFGHNVEWVWGGQGLFKTDGSGPVEGFVPLMRPLRSGCIRYPGGSLANTFRWADSVGPLAQRKPIANFFTLRGDPKTKLAYDTERCLLGFDDFMNFVKQAGATGAIVIVNCTTWPGNPEISGTAEEAAAWVAYANAAVGAPPVAIGKDKRGIDWRDSQYWAQLRAGNGHPEPYGVTYWEIGNEVNYADQGAGMDGAAYGKIVREFAERMKAVDPQVKVGAVLQYDWPHWNKPVAAALKGGPADFVILHKYGPGDLGGSVALWSDGACDVAFAVESAGKHTLTVEAAGQPAKGVFPLMRVALDGKDLGEFTVDASKDGNKKKAFPFEADLAVGRHVLTVSFLNDVQAPPEDRNLFIEGVTVQPAGGAKRPLTLWSVEAILQNMAGHAELLDSWHQAVLATLKAEGVDLPVRMTEYNALFGIREDQLKRSDTLASALYTARHLQKFLVAPTIEAANFWCVKSAYFRVVENGPEGLRPSPAGLVFQAMQPLAEGQVLTVRWVQRDDFEVALPSKRVAWMEAAAVRKDAELALNFVNWHPTRAAKVQVKLTAGQWAGGQARVLSVTGPGPEAANPENGPAQVRLLESSLPVGDAVNVELRPCSVTTVVLPLRAVRK